MSGSTCPACGGKNSTKRDRKHKFSVWQLFGFYIPFYSKDIVEFKFMKCRNCGEEYKEDNVRLFGFGPIQEKLFIIVVIFLFVLMILTTKGII